MTALRRFENPLDFVLANFEGLERELNRCMEYVPYVEANSNVVSPKFVPLLLESCGLVESVFKRAAGTTARHTFHDYSSLHESSFCLEEATTLFLVAPLDFLRPFRGWTRNPPSWWLAYNQLKHDRIANHATASYTNTVLALAAAHQVVARSRLFLDNLARAGWFNEASEAFPELLVAMAACAGPPQLPIESKLFVTAIRDDFVTWQDEVPTVDWEWPFTERVKNYLWSYEGY